jgi:hypothetical protein
MSRHWLAVMDSKRRSCDGHGCYCSAKNQLGEICHGSSSVSGRYPRAEDWFTLPQIPSRFLECASHRPTTPKGWEKGASSGFAQPSRSFQLVPHQLRQLRDVGRDRRPSSRMSILRSRGIGKNTQLSIRVVSPTTSRLYLRQSRPMLFPPGATKARPSGSQSPAALLCAQTDGRITPCRSALRKTSVGVKPYRHWDSPAYLSRWQAARAPQRTKRRRIRRRPHRVTNSFLVRRNSPTLAWRRSMSSTRKMPEHPRSPNS